ncbi:MAG: SDR family oxidoreductase [Proteobacteria bacterium]|nr:SDR family oxidoreductase [Pseudomonadota bacterium]
MTSVLVTGCDSGLGREFAQQYADAGWTVWATYRDIANALADDRMQHAALDVTAFGDFEALRQRIGGAPLDLLVSNAGIGLDSGHLGQLDFDYVHRMLAVNLVGALKLVETFVDNVAASGIRRIVLVTSRMGSIASNLTGGHYGYRASKAGLNAVGRSLALDLHRRGVAVTMIHPGWVNTAGGSPQAPLSARDSVSAMRATVARMGNHETGTYVSFDGQPLPW